MNLLNDDVKKLYRGYLFPALSGAVVTSVFRWWMPLPWGNLKGRWGRRRWP